MTTAELDGFFYELIKAAFLQPAFGPGMAYVSSPTPPPRHLPGAPAQSIKAVTEIREARPKVTKTVDVATPNAQAVKMNISSNMVSRPKMKTQVQPPTVKTPKVS